MHGEQKPFYWASQIESRWVEVAWWGRCGCQPERSRSGVNGKVLQEPSRMAELWQNIKCLPAIRAQRQSLQQFLRALYVVCVLSHSVAANNKHVIPEMLPYLRFIHGAGIFDKISCDLLVWLDLVPQYLLPPLVDSNSMINDFKQG